MIGVILSFVSLGVVFILILFLSRNNKRSKVRTELTDDEMFKIIQEEGFSPRRVSDGDIIFHSHDMTFTFGKYANGFVYARLYYRMNKEDRWLALQAAQYTEVSYVAIKVMLVPHMDTILFSVESLCNNPELFRNFIGKAMSLLTDSAIRYHIRMKELHHNIIVYESKYEDDSKIMSKCRTLRPSQKKHS